MSPVASVIIAGIITVAAGGVVCLRKALVVSGLWLQAAGLVAVGVGGALVALGDTSIGAAFNDSASFAFGIDPLSGFFLAVLALGGVPALVFAVGYLRGTKAARSVSVLTAAFLLALIGVLTARSVLAFLTFWELMTLCPAGMILIMDRRVQTRRSVFEYLAITHLGGVGVWVSLILLAANGVLSDPSAAQSLGAPLQAFIALAAIVGFGTKAGLMPLHSWLPRLIRSLPVTSRRLCRGS